MSSTVPLSEVRASGRWLQIGRRFRSIEDF
jgi:hypothetical protein